MANKLSMVFNCVVISLVLAVCLLYVPEAYCTDVLYTEESMGIHNSESYFIKKDDVFWLYSNDDLIMGVYQIPEEFKNIPIIEKEGS